MVQKLLSHEWAMFSYLFVSFKIFLLRSWTFRILWWFWKSSGIAFWELEPSFVTFPDYFCKVCIPCCVLLLKFLFHFLCCQCLDKDLLKCLTPKKRVSLSSWEATAAHGSWNSDCWTLSDQKQQPAIRIHSLDIWKRRSYVQPGSRKPHQKCWQLSPQMPATGLDTGDW